MEYLVQQYNQWVEDSISLTNAFSEESMRLMAIQLLMGRNYRLITENNTKSKLALTYLWLHDVIDRAKAEFGKDWKLAVAEDLMRKRHRKKKRIICCFGWQD